MLISLHLVKWFQVLLFKINNSIKRSFVRWHLNGQTVLFDLSMEPYQVQSLRVWVDLGAVAMNGYYSFLKGPEVEPHRQIVYCRMKDIHGKFLPI